MIKKSVFISGVAFALACLATPNRADAGSITLTFDYHLNAGVLTGPSGPWGTVTISDSVVDPNRVDITMTLTPPAGFVTLDQFYLNLDLQPDTPPTATDPDFIVKTQNYLVPTTNAAGNLSNTLGTVGYADGTAFFPLNGFVFDLNLNPTATPLTFTGSWTLYVDNTAPIADTVVNLDANMFNTPSAFTATGGQTIPMYAAFRARTATGTEFRAFASTAVVTPEPAMLSLFGIGVLGLARLRRRS